MLWLPLHAACSGKIDIEGVSRSLLFMELYNEACTHSGTLPRFMRQEIDIKEARRHVGTHVEVLNKVAMYVLVPRRSKGRYLDAREYNKHNGKELAERVVERARRQPSRRGLRRLGLRCDWHRAQTALAFLGMGVCISGMFAAAGCYAGGNMDMDMWAGPGGDSNAVLDTAAAADYPGVGGDTFDPAVDHAVIPASNGLYKVIVSCAFPASIDETNTFYDEAKSAIDTSSDVSAARDSLVAAVRSLGVHIDGPAFDGTARDALFDSAVKDAVYSSTKLSAYAKHILFDAEDAAERISKFLDALLGGTGVAPEERAVFAEAAVKALNDSEEAAGAKESLVAALREAIDSSPEILDESKNFEDWVADVRIQMRHRQ